MTINIGTDVLAGLSAEQRRAVQTAVADNVLEGWAPTDADLTRLSELAAGHITFEQYRAEVLAHAAT